MSFGYYLRYHYPYVSLLQFNIFFSIDIVVISLIGTSDLFYAAVAAAVVTVVAVTFTVVVVVFVDVLVVVTIVVVLVVIVMSDRPKAYR